MTIPMLWGCSSDKLSRESAENSIKEQMKFPIDDIRDIKLYDNQFTRSGETF